MMDSISFPQGILYTLFMSAVELAEFTHKNFSSNRWQWKFQFSAFALACLFEIWIIHMWFREQVQDYLLLAFNESYKKTFTYFSTLTFFPTWNIYVNWVS